MRIKADLLKVKHGRDAKGERVEPEAQPAARVITTDIPTGMQGGAQRGHIPGEVIFETTAGEMAEAARRPCLSCKHFNKKAWRSLYAAWNDPTAPIDKRKYLNGIRAALLETQNAKVIEKSTGQDGDMDVEHALGMLGVCGPLTEIDGADVVIVYPASSCPPEVRTKDRPNGLHEPKHKAAERQGSAVFDRIMNIAQGKL